MYKNMRVYNMRIKDLVKESINFEGAGWENEFIKTGIELFRNYLCWMEVVVHVCENDVWDWGSAISGTNLLFHKLVDFVPFLNDRDLDDENLGRGNELDLSMPTRSLFTHLHTQNIDSYILYLLQHLNIISINYIIN